MPELFSSFGLNYVTSVGILLVLGLFLLGSSFASVWVRDKFTLPKERYMRSGFHFTFELLAALTGLFCLLAVIVLFIPEWIALSWRVLAEFFNSIHF